MKLTIKNKLILIGGVVVIGLSLLFAISMANSSKIVKLHNIQSQLKDIQSSILQLRRNEKDFFIAQRYEISRKIQ